MNKKSKLTLLGTGLILVLFIACVWLLKRFPDSKIIKQTIEDRTDLEAYDSAYTYAEKNEDGTYNLYIYASAIQWDNKTSFRKIDNSIIDSNSDGYQYENAGNAVKTYLPENSSEGFLISQNEYTFSFMPENFSADGELISFMNLYGEEKEAVYYKIDNIGIYVYPIYTGFHIEYIFEDGMGEDDLSAVQWHFDQGKVKEVNAEYVLLEKDEDHLFVVSSPLIYVEDNDEYLPDAHWEYAETDQMTELRAQGNDEAYDACVHAAFSIQLHSEDMPDTTVYEKGISNVYLADKAIIGQHAYIGEGIHYLRYRLNYFFEIDAESILEASYHTRKLNYANILPKLAMYYPTEQWSSTLMLWSDRTAYIEEQCTEILEEKDYWVKFELTDFVKEAFSDESWMPESLGSVVTAENGFTILATSDNGEYIPYLCLKVKELPGKITQHQTINEVD